MAKLLPNFLFTGSMANMSAYKRRDSDKIILRTKGGPSKEKIETSPSFEVTRKNNKEFGGRATATSRLLMALNYCKPVTDYNIAGPLISLLRPIQALDTDSEKGTRHVLISRNPRLLEGFNFSKKHPFELMVRTPIEWTLSRETFNAQIEFPELIPGINFTLPDGNYPVYRLFASLAIIPDMFYGEVKYAPLPEHTYHRQVRTVSDWFPVVSGSEIQKLELQLPVFTGPSSYSLMLSAGVCFGNYNAAGTVDVVKYVGCGKIVGMV
jgi:hypothetical protein